jgi:putative membrane protein
MNGQTQKTDVNTELARERSRQAADRTLMAWVRTALSLIGFGFGIANFRDILVRSGIVQTAPARVNLALVFGLGFIALGTLGLLAATIQHWFILQAIKQDKFVFTGFRPLVFIEAIALMIIGLFGFFAILIY